MENDILIQEYEKKIAEIQSCFDKYKEETEARFLTIKEENKNEIDKINARYRDELRSVLSARSNTENKTGENKTDEKKTGEKKTDTENDDDDNDEDNHDSRIKRAIKKLKSKYKIGDE